MARPTGGKSGGSVTEAERREVRRAEALRANLKRRKGPPSRPSTKSGDDFGPPSGKE
ncbi:MAG: hypothetical protein SGJ21_03325 [Alphaproteobacteria bacterium]|nr:hypothetical protein [Alphaproteobacteria bacterium]